MRWAAIVGPGTAAGIIRGQASVREAHREESQRRPPGRHRKSNTHLKVGATSRHIQTPAQPELRRRPTDLLSRLFAPHTGY
jgi:hypothetical protein